MAEQRTMTGAMAFLEELVGESPGIMAIRERIGRLLARTSDLRRLPPVLIQGETGTGKGLVARALHRAGPRAQGPFVDVNCAAIPETLLEAEMFGFERGAFTDARQAKRGLFQTAHRGTLFLDEVGLLPEAIQAKLLTVLEERTVRRLGATQSEPIDVWIIAATNSDLQVQTRAGRFREDLYHRLAVLTLMLPPLRERGRDALVLAEHLLGGACADYGLPRKTLGPDAQAALLAYRWPGNVRELANTMERAALLGDGLTVTAEMLALPETMRAAVATEPPPPPHSPAATLTATVEQAERAHLIEALEATGWNVTRAAARLGVSRNTLRYRIEKHGLRPGGPASPRRQARSAPLPPASLAPAPPEADRGPAPAAIRWERRRLALLRAVAVVGPAEALVGTSRAVEVFVDKVRAFGGRVENLSPAALLGVFGLDPAEDAPRRAALAAIAIRKALGRADASDALPGIRLAIHVGPFMIGRLGETSMVDQDALRDALGTLKGLLTDARDDVIRVSATAAPLLARRFGLVSGASGVDGAPTYRLEGIERPDGVAGRAVRFVGRAHDIEFLRSRLDLAVRGHGQVVAIVGEAGIGKSRLLAEFRERAAGESLLYLESQCVSYGASTPYHVLLDLFRAAFRLVETDGPDAVRAKVGATLAALGMAAERAQPYMLRLLGIPDETESLTVLTPDAIRARTFEALRELVVRLSGRDPVVLVVEDLHWIDRTSEEFLVFLAEVVSGARVLLATTHRPGHRPPWLGKSYATQLALQPLGPADSRAVVLDVLGASAPPGLVTAILGKAEGNPFFLEELARAVRDHRDTSSRLPMPDTIEEVLLARIDRLPPDDKAVLQCASVIGRTAPLGLLQAVTDLPEETLRGALARLQGAEFLHENRLGPEPEYAFRHVLVQDAAYESLLPAQRQTHHARIVDVLESRFPDTVQTKPELLARHCAEAQLLDRAAAYHHEAGRRASERSASAEAITHLATGLELVGGLSDTPERSLRELSLLITLGPALINARGPLSLEVVRNYSRALEVCRELPESPLHFAALWGSWRISPNFHTKLERGHQLLAVAERLRDPALRLQAHHCLWASLFHLGQHDACCEHVEQGLRLYEAGDYRAHGAVYGGHDPKVCALGERAMALWLLGYPERALAASRDAMTWARTLGHAGSLVHALLMAMLLHGLRRDAEAAERDASDLMAGAEEHGFPVHRAWGLVFRGWALSNAGRREEGLELMRRNLDVLSAVGTREDFPVLFEMLAEAHAAAGQPEQALEVLDRALAESEGNGLAYWTAELHRRRGEVLAAMSGEHEEEVRTSWLRALTVARGQRARSLELRAATGLARLQLRRGDPRGALEQLAPVLGTFVEGLDSPDLCGARRVLEEATEAAGAAPPWSPSATTERAS